MISRSIATASQLSPPSCQWHPATWQEYLALRDAPIQERLRLFFNQGWMWATMGAEGIVHANISDLFISLPFFWAVQHLDQVFNTYGRCLLEKPETQACAPDLVVYVGEGYPRWQPGELRRINLDQWRVPDLVGEISDTSLAFDLDEQKHLYAALGIPEYWVIDVQGQRVFAFRLKDGTYETCDRSSALSGLPITMLEQTLIRACRETNTSAAAWFTQQIAAL
jgi:Uma2 family endonuclease